MTMTMAVPKLTKGTVKVYIPAGCTLFKKNVTAATLTMPQRKYPGVPPYRVKQQFVVSVADIRTADGTQAQLELSGDKIKLSFKPPLQVDVTGPWNFVRIQSVTYHFGNAQTQSKGKIDSQVTVEKMLGFFKVPIVADKIRATIKNEVHDRFKDLIKGTVYDTPGYNPMQSPDPMQGLNQVAANLKSGASPAQINKGVLRELGNASGSFTIETKDEFFRMQELGDLPKGAKAGGIYIPKGAKIKVDISLMSVGRYLRFSHMEFNSEQIFVQRAGQNAMILNQVRIDRGFTVTISRYTALGEVRSQLSKPRDGETALRFIALLWAIREAPARERLAIRDSDREVAGEFLAPRIVDGAPSPLVSDVLQKTFRAMYSENYPAIKANLPPGFNLDDVTGARPDGSPVSP